MVRVLKTQTVQSIGYILNYNIPVRSYSILNNKKACKIKAYGVLQTPKSNLIK